MNKEKMKQQNLDITELEQGKDQLVNKLKKL